MKLIKSVVSLRYDFCLGCKSESTKLEIRSVGPLLPETIGLPAREGKKRSWQLSKPTALQT